MEAMFDLIDPDTAEAIVHWTLMGLVAVTSLHVVLLIESRSYRKDTREVLRSAVRLLTPRAATASGSTKKD